MNARIAALSAAALVAASGLAGHRPAVAATAAGALRPVEVFDAGTWATLQATLKRPAMLVFSTTDCAHCPAVFEQLANERRRRGLKAALIAVVMDVAPSEDDAMLQAQPHLQRVDRLFAFAGQAPVIRYSVEPRWRGVTPYVVFLTPGQAVQAVTGPPSEADIDAWVRRSAAATTTR